MQVKGLENLFVAIRERKSVDIDGSILNIDAFGRRREKRKNDFCVRLVFCKRTHSFSHAHDRKKDHCTRKQPRRYGPLSRINRQSCPEYTGKKENHKKYRVTNLHGQRRIQRSESVRGVKTGVSFG